MHGPVAFDTGDRPIIFNVIGNMVLEVALVLRV